MNRNYFSTILNTFCIEVSGPVFVFLLLFPQTKVSKYEHLYTETHGSFLNIHLADSPANSSSLRIN